MYCTYEGDGLYNHDKQIGQLKASLGYLTIEELRAFFYSGDGDLIGYCTICKGKLDSVDLCPRKIASILHILNADFVVMAHNHPSGDCAPSERDVTATRFVASLLKCLGATLLDHVIVTRSDTFSFRAHGYL